MKPASPKFANLGLSGIARRYEATPSVVKPEKAGVAVKPRKKAKKPVKTARKRAPKKAETPWQRWRRKNPELYLKRQREYAKRSRARKQ